jgi:outer membrane protein assembly factor BamE (lipoprotein component of BamABCDE complex)
MSAMPSMNSAIVDDERPPQFRMRTALLWITVLAIALGCMKSCHDALTYGTIRFEMLSQVTVGMTQAEVEKLLGPPASRKANNTEWDYFERYNTNIMSDPITIYFDEQGRVIEP